MPTKYFTFPQLLFFLLLLFGKSQLGFGKNDENLDVNQSEEIEQDGDGNEGDQNNHENPKDSPTFTAVSSLFFTPGTDYKVFFTVDPHPKNKPLQLKCVLMAKTNECLTIESAPISLRPAESGQISIPLPREIPGNKTVWSLFAWSFTSRSAADGYKYEAPHTLIVSRKLPNQVFRSPFKIDLLSVFIQTDKPVYKPDDLVRIRVITIGSDDLPHLTSGVNITITDSQGNLMKKWEQPRELPESTSAESNVSTNQNVALFGEFQKKKNGLSSFEFQLSSEPILGNWTIQVEAGNVREKMNFEVKKYILPKFQVKIQVPPVLYGRGEISAAATVKVSYTYGQGLQGTGNVTVSSGKGALKHFQPFMIKDGEATVQLSLSASQTHPTVHNITANVTEKNTGRWKIGKATIRIYPHETFSVEWINKPSSYKPGLPLTVTLKISSQDGFLVKDVRKNALRVTFPPSLNLSAHETSIPSSGIATFTVPTTIEPIPANSQLQINYKRSTHNISLPAAERGTFSGVFIEIVSPPDSLNFIRGHSYNFSIRSNKPIQPEIFHCLLWNEAALEVLGAQNIINSLKENATEFPFSLRIPNAAYTNLKIFVYFETEHGGFQHTISTSKLINTHNYLKIRVSRPIPGIAPAPEINNSTDIDIDGVSSAPDASVETTTATIDQSDYEYEDFPNDDPAVLEPEPETSDKLQVEPGAAVEIHFETYPDSTIAIRGIDQSLLLLTQQDNDLTQEKVESNRAASQIRKSHLDSIPSDSSFFLKAFRRLGIAVLNSKSFTSFAKSELGATSMGGKQQEEEVASPPGADFNYSRIPQVDSRLRTKFPETWLWEDFQSSNDSTKTVLRKTLPDTLTSWIINGFSLNPKTGLGVASPATIIGFMPFFVTLNLPYSVMRYEAVDIQVIVHNYLDRDVGVWVTLYKKENNSKSGFSFVDARQIRLGKAVRFIKVSRNNVAVAHFVITTLTVGEIPIEVSAVTEDGLAGDSMLRHLKVKPDGVKQTRSQLVMFSRTSPRTAKINNTRVKRFNVEFPSRMVKGGNSLQLTIVGDPMGTVVSNLDKLLRVPYGCGEQNMIAFVPNILALDYLDATNSDKKETMDKATKLLEKGYQHQLQYKLKDGSFAVWKSNSGSTWLTAYVLRWFVTAQKYITIDNKVISGAINFIRSKQNPDGSFVETGAFYHPEMRGRTGAAGVALTAYITLALTKANETSNNDLDLKVAIENGMDFISQEAVYKLDDNYITNLVTATLIAGNHREKIRFFEKMEKRANATTTKDGVTFTFWDMINEREKANGPLAIEMTSYALLAHLWKAEGTDNSVMDIYKWLLSQRNPQGGFMSTQDTVMGLTALTQFALRTKGNAQSADKLQLNIRTSGSVSSNSSTKLTVGRWNRMVLHEFPLPPKTKTVTVRARGSGPALVQLTETWFVPTKSSPFPDGGFNITSKMSIPDPKEPSETELEVCVNSCHVNGARDSIASIQLPSGYVFSPEDYEDDSNFMNEKPENVQRFELTEGNTKMDVYYSYIQGHPCTCITLPATQIHEVANPKMAPIHVYEYLNPDDGSSILQKPAHNLKVCDLCRRTGACHLEECGS